MLTSPSFILLNKMAVSYKTPIKFSEQEISGNSSPSRNNLQQRPFTANSSSIKMRSAKNGFGLRKTSEQAITKVNVNLKKARSRTKLNSGILPEQAEII